MSPTVQTMTAVQPLQSALSQCRSNKACTFCRSLSISSPAVINSWESEVDTLVSVRCVLTDHRWGKLLQWFLFVALSRTLFLSGQVRSLLVSCEVLRGNDTLFSPICLSKVVVVTFFLFFFLSKWTEKQPPCLLSCLHSYKRKQTYWEMMLNRVTIWTVNANDQFKKKKSRKE